MYSPKILVGPTRYGIVLVPSDTARVQDLGRFRSGTQMETDILSGSALVAASEDGKLLLNTEGKVPFAFEGNANGAVNLERFHEKCAAAAGRLATRAPSIAYGVADLEDLVPVAEYDLLRFVFTRVIDRSALEDWANEPVSSFLPPETLTTPTEDPEATAPLCDLPMRVLSQGQGGIYAWTLQDGTILTKEADPAAPLRARRPGDPGLDADLARAGVDLGTRTLMGM